jgi:hypothetical protein
MVVVSCRDTYFEKLRLVVAGIYGGLVCAGVGVELAAVNGNGDEDERAIGLFGEAAMLPLHDALWTCRVSSCFMSC